MSAPKHGPKIKKLFFSLNVRVYLWIFNKNMKNYLINCTNYMINNEKKTSQSNGKITILKIPHILKSLENILCNI